MLIQFYYYFDDSIALDITRKLGGSVVSRNHPSGFCGCDAPSGYVVIDTKEKTLDDYHKVMCNSGYNLESGDFITETYEDWKKRRR